MIAGFEKPDSGRIELDGHDVAEDPPHKRPVNTVFQTYALFPFMSVWDNVAFGLRYQKASRDDTKRRVGEALDLVRMTDYAKRRPTNCPAVSSSGSRWPGRWCCARACCCSTSRSARWTPSCAVPRSGASRPAISSSRVDLPHPDGPTSPQHLAPARPRVEPVDHPRARRTSAETRSASTARGAGLRRLCRGSPPGASDVARHAPSARITAQVLKGRRRDLSRTRARSQPASREPP